MGDLIFREEPTAADRSVVRALVEGTGFFYPEEAEVAVELVEERLTKGVRSGYHFVFTERDGIMLGYACYGPIACTQASYDLYWIVVRQDLQGAGLGRALLARAEQRIGELGGTRVYVETSSRPLYDPTRAFYLRCGYREEARLAEFYGPGDDKVILVRALPPPTR
ncbi:MAG: GNAT family N-acetyltransferase [Deltaproteobacteria bacterium]|nr:GNAT family N-acetyltransferase [Deltaproteobacteria bacterium]